MISNTDNLLNSNVLIVFQNILVNMWSTVFMFILVLTPSFGSDDLIVNLTAGNIRGHVLQSYEGNNYYAFQEIPYAAPPVGENRFQLPKPPEPWDGILNTTKNTKVCQQANKYVLEKTEDCLYLNVYSPVKPGGNDKLPVLFWIHGGGLNWGSGTYNDYGPKYIMDYGIVVVAINYRLNAFGFASTDDDVIPGNLGLKDQRFALEWVNQHINLFGGDPDHVTIAGESSGSAAVGLLVMGNWNGEKELFHAAIQESGSMIGGTLQTNAKENIIGLAKYLDPTFESEKSEDILEVLKKASAEDILKAGRTYGNMIEKSGYYSLLPLQSFMDGNFKKVPMMIGFNSEEWIKYAKNRSNGTLKGFDDNPELLIHKNLNMSPENRHIAGKLMKKVYTSTTFVNDFGAYIRWSSDQSFSTPTGKQIELGCVHAPYFVYQFAYKGDLGGMMDDIYIVPGAERVGHMEDLHYWWEFLNNNDMSQFPEEDQLMMRRFLTLWTNFIKYYNPTPKADPLLLNVTWPMSNPDSLTYLNINSTFEVRENPRVYKDVKPIIEKYMEPPYVSFG
ncbi:juvenile hormone esterase-like isoform X2 [Diabrotica undecimpunctata]|uniref:juvenile hormone esterase-like isoform X2 n=1 Tax=Diabrotica undecimpunctata TaxID=50387 RepID=UPI003B632B52